MASAVPRLVPLSEASLGSLKANDGMRQGLRQAYQITAETGWKKQPNESPYDYMKRIAIAKREQKIREKKEEIDRNIEKKQKKGACHRKKQTDKRKEENKNDGNRSGESTDKVDSNNSKDNNDQNDSESKKYSKIEVKLDKWHEINENKLSVGLSCMDITALYEMIPRACPEIINLDKSPRNALENSLQEGKDFRNKISHEESVTVTINDARRIANDILKYLWERFPQPQHVMDQKQEQVCKIFDEIERIYSTSLESIAERLSGPLRKEVLEKFEEQWAEELFMFTNKPVKYSKVYQFIPMTETKPQSSTGDKLEDAKSQPSIDVTLEDVLASDARFVVIQGPPGAGKTSLYKKICLRLASDQNSKSILLPILARDKQFSSLEDYLYITFKDTFRGVKKADVIQIICQLNLTFAIDGLDEINDNSMALILEFINSHSGPNNQIFATARVGSDAGLVKHCTIRKITVASYDIAGITKVEDQVKFIKNYFTELGQNATDACIKQFKTISGKMEQQFSLPINMVLYCALYTSDNNNVKNINNIAVFMQRAIALMHYIMEERLTEQGIVDAKPISRLVMEFLYSEAARCLLKKRLWVDENAYSHFDDICRESKYKIPVNNCLSALLFRSSSPFSAEVTFSFYHKTQIESLAAKALIDTMEKADHATASTSSGVKAINTNQPETQQQRLSTNAPTVSVKEVTNAPTVIVKERTTLFSKMKSMFTKPKVNTNVTHQVYGASNVTKEQVAPQLLQNNIQLMLNNITGEFVTADDMTKFRQTCIIAVQLMEDKTMQNFLTELQLALTQAGVGYDSLVTIMVARELPVPGSYNEAVLAMVAGVRQGEGSGREDWNCEVRTAAGMAAVTALLPRSRPDQLDVSFYTTAPPQPETTLLLNVIKDSHYDGKLELDLRHSYEEFIPCDDLLSPLQAAKCRLGTVYICVGSGEGTAWGELPVMDYLYVALTEPLTHRLLALDGRVKYLLTVRVRHQPVSSGPHVRPLPLERGGDPPSLTVDSIPPGGVSNALQLVVALAPKGKRYGWLCLQRCSLTDAEVSALLRGLQREGIRAWGDVDTRSVTADSTSFCFACDPSSCCAGPGQCCLELYITDAPPRATGDSSK